MTYVNCSFDDSCSSKYNHNLKIDCEFWDFSPDRWRLMINLGEILKGVLN